MTHAELVVQLEDAAPETRLAAATALLEGNREYKSDRALMERIVAAAERERDGEAKPNELCESSLPHKLGELVASIELGPAALWPRARAIIETHPVPALRLALIRYILSFNSEAEMLEQVIDALIAIASDPHPAIRAQALDALQIDVMFPASVQTKLFQLFVDKLDNVGASDPEVASRALQNLGGWIELRPDLFDIYLSSVAPLVESDSVVPYRCMYGLGRMLDARSEATAEQLARALTFVMAIARNAKNRHERGVVFPAVAERGGAEGRKLLESLKKDADVGDDAKSVLRTLARARSK